MEVEAIRSMTIEEIIGKAELECARLREKGGV